MTEVQPLHLCEVATLRTPFDLVFVIMKAYDTRWAVELIKPHVHPNGLVVGVQNGMTVDTVADVMGPERTLGAVIEISSAMWEAGIVERHMPPSSSWFALGGIEPSAHARAEGVAEILRHAGTVQVTDDIRSAKWMKLVVNAAELVPAAIVDQPMRAAAALPGMREFMIKAGIEAMEAGVAAGRTPMPIFGLQGLEGSEPRAYVEPLIDAVFDQFALETTTTTVLQDWSKGRHSEVDEINGLVVREHARVGTSLPGQPGDPGHRSRDRARGVQARSPPARADAGGSPMRIAVLGTGANGAGVAADMVRAGHEVTLIEQWPANVDAMRAHGVRVEMPEETVVTPVRAIHLCEVATLRERFDVVFLLMKAYDTRWACELIKPHLSEGGVVAGIQNGMTADTIAGVVGPARTLGSVIEVAAAMYSPGVVERHTPPSGSWFALGGLVPEGQAKASAVADILGSAGTVEVVDDIRSSKWMKLVVNAAELVPSAIVDLPLLEAASLPGMHDFMLAAGKEAVRTAVGLGHRTVPDLRSA